MKLKLAQDFYKKKLKYIEIQRNLYKLKVLKLKKKEF